MRFNISEVLVPLIVVFGFVVVMFMITQCEVHRIDSNKELRIESSSPLNLEQKPNEL